MEPLPQVTQTVLCAEGENETHSEREAAKKQSRDKTSSYSVSFLSTASQHIPLSAKVNSNQVSDHLQIKTVLCNSSPSTRTDQTSNCYRQVENLWRKVPGGLSAGKELEDHHRLNLSFFLFKLVSKEGSDKAKVPKLLSGRGGIITQGPTYPPASSLLWVLSQTQVYTHTCPSSDLLYR